jgi:hypothetical protein
MCNLHRSGLHRVPLPSSRDCFGAFRSHLRTFLCELNLPCQLFCADLNLAELSLFNSRSAGLKKLPNGSLAHVCLLLPRLVGLLEKGLCGLVVPILRAERADASAGRRP